MQANKSLIVTKSVDELPNYLIYPKRSNYWPGQALRFIDV
jgi:hypothetical protein